MTIAKTAVTVLASTSSAAGTTTKASPSVTGSAINVGSYYGGELTYKITNGAAPPVIGLTLMFQASHDGTNWYDYFPVAGDTAVSGITSGSLRLDEGVMFVRALAYGNTTNAVTVEAYLQAVTAV